MPRYALAPHVYACLDGQHVVLLDLKQDRYFSFEAAQARCLDTLVFGWPRGPELGEVAVHEVDERDHIAQRLAERGLLTHDGAAARAVGPPPIPGASVELASDQYAERRTVGIRTAAAFLSATLIAAILLRLRSLERAVQRVKSRRARMTHVSSLFDIDRTRELVEIFIDLRPFLFTSREACLFESLVLIEFLARHHIFPNWVFGVQARPFAAHCWVQQGDTVLNDTIEHLSRYTPIMAV